MAKNRLLQALFAPVDNTFLVYFRVIFASVLLYHVWTYFSADLIRTFYIEPQIHFSWYGFDWIRPWTGTGMYVHFYVLGVAAVCMLLGFYYRLAAATFCLGFSHALLIDQCWYQNHYYLVALLSFLSIFVPANQSCSIDAWRSPPIRSDVCAHWSLFLLRFQVGIPYFFGGLAKINTDWLLHGQPMQMWLAKHTDVWLIGNLFAAKSSGHFFSYAGLLFDLLVVPLMLWPRTRLFAFAWVIVFHLLNARIFPIGYFPWMMLPITLLLFSSPDRIASLRFWPRKQNEGETAASRWQSELLPKGWIVAAMGLYLSFQLLVPLRHLLLAGNPAWTNEACHFSWRMMLHERHFQGVYRAVNPASGDSGIVDGNRPLTIIQQAKLRHPDTMLQIGRAVSKQLTTDPQRPVEVYVDAQLALNGRAPQQFTDPNVNMAFFPRTIGHNSWIVPFDPQRKSPETEIQDTPVNQVGPKDTAKRNAP